MNKSDFINVEVLSKREREVARIAADGFANKTIARKLNITEGTVKLHLHRVYQKLGIKNRHALTTLAANISYRKSVATKHERIVPRVLDRKIGRPQKSTSAVRSDVKIQRKH